MFVVWLFVLLVDGKNAILLWSWRDSPFQESLKQSNVN